MDNNSISISAVRMATPKQWDEIWRVCDFSTYFHGREWAEIWNVYSNASMMPAPRMVEFSDGKMALLPLSVIRGRLGLSMKYMSSPAWTFGGWISADDLGPDHAELLAWYLMSEFANIFWRLNPYDESVLKLKVRTVSDDTTNAIDLRNGFEAIYGTWPKKIRGSEQKARREGVIVRTATILEDWREYYDVYRDSLSRWDRKATSIYGWGLFEEMHKRGSPNIRLWLAVYDGRIISGDLLFYSKRHVVDWHGATLEDYFHLRPVNLLTHEIIKDACERGYWWFDFNPSGGHEGVELFKKRFGTISLPCPVFEKRGSLAAVLEMLGL